MKPYRIRSKGSAVPFAAGLLALAGAAALLLAGCAAERQVIQPGAGLSADTLRAEGMALVGITVLDEVEQLRPPLVATFEKVLAAVRPDLPIRPASATREALGLPAYRKLLFAYQGTGKLEPGEQEALRMALGSGTRYAILARVEKNSVRASGGTKPPASTTMGGGGTMPPASVPYSVMSRDARIRFTIYDLAETRGVFEATYASSSDNRIPLPPDGPPEKGSPSGDLQVPESPSLAEALIEGYRAFALDLPAAKSGSAPDSSAAR